MSTAGFLGAFPAALTTGSQNIGAAQMGGGAQGYPGAFPASLTTGLMTIGAAQKAKAVAANTGNMFLCF